MQSSSKQNTHPTLSPKEQPAKDDITARILSKAQEQSGGGWVHLAASNLAIQALMVVGIDGSLSIKWLVLQQDGDEAWDCRLSNFIPKPTL